MCNDLILCELLENNKLCVKSSFVSYVLIYGGRPQTYTAAKLLPHNDNVQQTENILRMS